MAVTARHFESMAGHMLVDEEVSQAEFARRVDCSRQNIGKLVKAGKIHKNENKKLNFYEALRAYEENTDPSHHERLSKLGEKSESSAAESSPGNYHQHSLKLVNDGDRFKKARAKREENTADLAELKLAKEAGELIDAKKVQQDAFNLARGLRDALFNIPDRLAPILAAEQDDRKVSSILEEEIAKALNGLAAAGEKLKADVS